MSAYEIRDSEVPGSCDWKAIIEIRPDGEYVFAELPTGDLAALTGTLIRHARYEALAARTRDKMARLADPARHREPGTARSALRFWRPDHIVPGPDGDVP